MGSIQGFWGQVVSLFFDFLVHVIALMRLYQKASTADIQDWVLIFFYEFHTWKSVFVELSIHKIHLRLLTGVLTVAQWVNDMVVASLAAWVQSLAWPNGLRTPHSQLWLGFDPGLGTSICSECGQKKKKDSLCYTFSTN